MTESGPSRPTYVMRDPQVMRAVAHPARLAIMEYLAEGNEATATECADLCGLSPSATSYHLRALAKVGLIEDAPSRGDGRERVWRSPHNFFMIDAEAGVPADAQDAALELVEVVLRRDEEEARRFLARRDEVPKEWDDAAGMYRLSLLLTPDELVTLTKAVNELMRPFGRSTRLDPPEEARRVVVLFRAFPSDLARPRGVARKEM